MKDLSRRRAVRVTFTVITTAVLFFVSAIPAWAMTLTFVRHAESQANADGVIDTSVPGPGLTPLGQQQATDVAAALVGNGYDGIYVSSMLRTQQTAAPLAGLTGQPVVVLPGLREISAGIFEGSSEDEGLGRLGYALGPVAWTLGARLLPTPGGEDGNSFDARVDDAIEQIYNSGDQNAVAFSHGATIMFWVMMNVDNPDLGLLLSHQLENAEQVVIEGSPEEGWTLVNWAGVPVSAEPSLPTKLFVNVRNLVVAPQTALYEIGRAFASGDIGALANAVRDGIVNVARAAINFVPDMVTDIVGSIADELPVTSDQQVPEPESVVDEDSSVRTLSTAATEKKRNGATDLSDGNKAEPGEPLSSTETRSDDSVEEVAEEAGEETVEETEDRAVEEAPEEAPEEAAEDAAEETADTGADTPDTGDAETDSATSQQAAA